MVNYYYLDACIWLNLFKKEGDPSKGKPYWEIAEEFVNKIYSSKDMDIAYSSFVLREIELILNDEGLFNEKKALIIKESKSISIIPEKTETSFARKLESESEYNLSFYDCMHVAICRRHGFILVTRDKKLLEFAKRYIMAAKPEDLFI